MSLAGGTPGAMLGGGGARATGRGPLGPMLGGGWRGAGVPCLEAAGARGFPQVL